MIRKLALFLLCFGITLATLSNNTPMEFAGGILVAWDEVNQLVYVYDAAGKILETKAFHLPWTTSNIQALGLQTTCADTKHPFFIKAKASIDGRQISLPYGQITSRTGNYFKPQSSGGAPVLLSDINSPQILVSSQSITVSSNIPSSGRVFISAPEIHLKDGFNALRGSEFRVIAQ